MNDLVDRKREAIKNLNFKCKHFYGSYTLDSNAYKDEIDKIKIMSKDKFNKIGLKLPFIAEEIAERARVEYIEKPTEFDRDLPKMKKTRLIKNLNDVIFEEGETIEIDFGRLERENPSTHISAEVETDESLYEHVPLPFNNS